MKESEEDLKQRLEPLQFHITQEGGTELPFQNPYWDHKEGGIYVDIVSGQALFSSKDKYDSGSGWPSFTQAISDSAVEIKTDTSHGMRRMEVRSSEAHSHLGHVFEDGPPPKGKRYCINSAALRFIPADRLIEEGYGEFKKIFDTK